MAFLNPTRSEQEWLAHFGIVPEQVEAAISGPYGSDEFYVGHGLSAEALYTSFSDYEALLRHPLMRAGERVIDLGAGLGKGTLLAREWGLPLEVLSLEYVRERHEAGKMALEKRGHASSEMILCDLRNTPLPIAGHYFIYLPTGILLSHLLEELKRIAQNHQFYLWAIESHGDLIPTLKNFAPFLLERDSGIALTSIRHDQKLYLFQSCKRTRYEPEHFEKQNEILAGLGVPEAQLLIVDQDLGAIDSYQWIASLNGLSMGVRAHHLQATLPPREFAIDRVQSVLTQVPPEFKKWINLRDQDVELPNLGRVRKIIIAPTPMIEFSLAGRIEMARLA